MRIILIDTVYPDFIRTLPFDPSSTYEDQLAAVLARQFGTSDFFSRNLRPLGWEAIDIIANYRPLQELYQRDKWQGAILQAIALQQIADFKPECVFLQDLSFFDAATLRMLADRYLLAGQISCALPSIESVKQMHCIFSSFPFYVPKFQEMGIRAVYLPLAFEPSVLNRRPPKLPKPIGPGVTIGYDTMLWSGDELIGVSPELYDADRLLPPERDIDISFVGGVGRDSHWKQGTDTLEIVAQAFKERFHWYGYGADRLPQGSALYDCYRGPAWGKEMYSVYRRSKIVINRHGEVAEGYANNLRMFEATGCGAALLTEAAPNLGQFFEYNEALEYRSPSKAIEWIQALMDSEGERLFIAKAGQHRTLADHTYAQRMKVVSKTLTEMLCPA